VVLVVVSPNPILLATDLPHIEDMDLQLLQPTFRYRIDRDV
jgi:hypothetical protein